MITEYKFLMFQASIIIPFLTGMFVKSRLSDPAGRAKKLVRFNLIFLEPAIVIWSIWGLKFAGHEFLLPFSGLLLVLTGLVTGRLTIQFLRLKSKGIPTYIISSSLANHGFTMGGFLCYLFFGEKGLGLAAIFIFYFMFYTFIVIFYYAEKSSTNSTNSVSVKSVFLSLQTLPLYSAIAATILNFSDIKRPEIFFPFDLFLVVSVSLYYFTLGINFSFKDIFPVGREHISLAFSKFIILPVLTGMILYSLNIDKDIKSVIILQSFMPAAIYSVVTSILFDLDTKLASSLFFINTVIFIFIILPILFTLIKFAGI